MKEGHVRGPYYKSTYGVDARWLIIQVKLVGEERLHETEAA